MRTTYIIFIIFSLTINAGSKEMKIIAFDSNLSTEAQGKIIYNDKILKINNIALDDRNRKIWWQYTDPLFFGKNYIVIKNYRYWAKPPYYNDYSIVILDENFNFKEELFKIRDYPINSIAINSNKKIVAFTITEEKKIEPFRPAERSFLKLYDLDKRKIIFTKEMGQKVDFTVKAFNSTDELICFDNSIAENIKKGEFTRYREKDRKVILYDIKNGKETVIDEGLRASFITDNLIIYLDKDFKRLNLYNLKTNKKEKYFSCSIFDMITNYFVSPDNKQIIIFFTSRHIVNGWYRRTLYDFETKKEIKWDLLKEICSTSHIDWQFDE